MQQYLKNSSPYLGTSDVCLFIEETVETGRLKRQCICSCGAVQKNEGTGIITAVPKESCRPPLGGHPKTAGLHRIHHTHPCLCAAIVRPRPSCSDGYSEISQYTHHVSQTADLYSTFEACTQFSAHTVSLV